MICNVTFCLIFCFILFCFLTNEFFTFLQGLNHQLYQIHLSDHLRTDSDFIPLLLPSVFYSVPDELSYRQPTHLRNTPIFLDSPCPSTSSFFCLLLKNLAISSFLVISIFSKQFLSFSSYLCPLKSVKVTSVYPIQWLILVLSVMIPSAAFTVSNYFFLYKKY